MTNYKFWPTEFIHCA